MNGAMTAADLPALALEFVRSEFVPTLWLLAATALREPLTWGVLGAAALPSLWRRMKTPARSQRA